MKPDETAGGHVDPGEILAWTDGEVPPERAAVLLAHVEACPACAEMMKDVQRAAALFSENLRATDAPPPRGSAGEVRRRVARRRLARSVPAAAVLVLLLAGGVLALVPGWPLHSWLQAMRADETSPADSAALPLLTRLSVLSPDSVDVIVGEPAGSLEVQIVRSAGRRLEVSTPPEGTLGRLELGSATLHVEPGSARVLRIVAPVGGRVRILAESGRLLVPADTSRTARSEGHDSLFVVRLGGEVRGRVP